jgi:hypothetical protein
MGGRIKSESAVGDAGADQGEGFSLKDLSPIRATMSSNYQGDDFQSAGESETLKSWSTLIRLCR